MKRVGAAGAALELPTAATRSAAEQQRKRFSFSACPTHKLMLVALAAMGFMMSCVMFTEMLHMRVFRSVRASLGFRSSGELTVDEMNRQLERQYLKVSFDSDELLQELQSARMHREFALSFSHFAQQTTIPRGVVLPLFDDIALLGMSLIVELRALNVDLPIEVPHCGDLKPEYQNMIRDRDPLVRVYDICTQALAATNVFGSGRRLFCGSLKQCHRHFRDFNIKVLAVVFSRFEEVMLLDADTLFFQSPMKLWDTERYNRTGTLFFHDRISSEDDYMAERIANTKEGRQVSHLHMYLSKFDVSPYEPLAAIPRAKPRRKKKTNGIPVKLHFQPSEFLLSSHAWNLRSGHEMDSSLVLWNKTKQPRATAILASFVALNGVPMPPSYGDKERFFLACELAETEYAFSDFSVGSLGTDLHDSDGIPDSVLCGGGLHYFPMHDQSSASSSYEDAELLYVNSDDILAMDVANDQIYRSLARAASFYPGSFLERGIPQECPFDIMVVPLTAAEKQKIQGRQQFHRELQDDTL
ncbi:hypothetical protein FI667_g7102, partial [Globisporangium splendens]